MTLKEVQKEARQQRRDRNDKIMSMLNDGMPVDDIVRSTGLGKSQIYAMWQRLKVSAGKAAVADLIPDSPAEAVETPVDIQPTPEPESALEPEPESESTPDAPEPEQQITPAEASFERLIQAAYVAGVGLEEIASAFDIDLSEIDLERGTKQAGVLRKSQVLARLQAERPAQWLAWKTEQEEAAQKRQMDRRIDRDMVKAFIGDIINHQSRLLIESDFQVWVQWLEELQETRYPGLV